MKYAPEQCAALYELGRLYLEMGYFVPAERIFSGLVAVEGDFLAARLGIGAVKLERGLFQEAAAHFRTALQAGGPHSLLSKVGLVAAFLGMQDVVRARSLLSEVAKDLGEKRDLDPDVRTLIEAFAVRLG